MTRNRAIVLAVLALVVGGVVVVVLRGSSDAPQVAARPSSPTKRVGRDLLSMKQLMAEGHAKAGDAPDPLEPISSSTAGLEDAVGELLDTDPNLRKFYNLRKKAVRTSAEQQDYLAMISDAKLIANARKDLLEAISQQDVDQVEELKRLQHIQFLNSALAWNDNPVRAQALEAVSEVVMQDLPTTAPKAVTGSVLGDKFDLFQLLMLSDPGQAQALLDKARGTRSEKILQLAWQTGTPAPPNNTP
jgi:hypothetical protein